MRRRLQAPLPSVAWLLVWLLFPSGGLIIAQKSPQPPRLPLTLLREVLAVCPLPPGASLPEWAANEDSFVTISRTPTELSITVVQRSVPSGVECERDYRAFRVHGPLPLDLIGILDAIARPLAEAGISIFAISTYETDYVLVKERDLSAARTALVKAGHQIDDER